MSYWSRKTLSPSSAGGSTDGTLNTGKPSQPANSTGGTTLQQNNGTPTRQNATHAWGPFQPAKSTSGVVSKDLPSPVDKAPSSTKPKFQPPINGSRSSCVRSMFTKTSTLARTSPSISNAPSPNAPHGPVIPPPLPTGNMHGTSTCYSFYR